MVYMPKKAANSEVEYLDLSSNKKCQVFNAGMVVRDFVKDYPALSETSVQIPFAAIAPDRDAPEKKIFFHIQGLE